MELSSPLPLVVFRFFFSKRRRHTRCSRDWSSDVCSSDLLLPDNLSDYTLLRQNSPVPIAGGEVLTRRQSFVPWLQGGAFDIVQPDVTKVGGISEERRIAWMAEENGIRFIPHGWNTALGLAADLQLASACKNTDLVEYLTGSPFIDEIVEAT